MLFTLAENLTQMELQVEVDEADVGKIDVGQQATFTVAAYPAKSFSIEKQSDECLYAQAAAKSHLEQQAKQQQQ